MDTSTGTLKLVVSAPAKRFRAAAAACAGPLPASFGLAELNSLLSSLTPQQLGEAVADPPAIALMAYLANYVAAMVEYACEKGGIALPAWTGLIPPLEEPVFGSTLLSLRLHLLTQSPPPFSRRNIFIDASVGDQI